MIRKGAMKEKGCVLVVVLIAFFCNIGLCQDSLPKPTRDKPHFIFSGGLSYQNQLVGEAGFIYGYSAPPGPCSSGHLRGIKVATEFNFIPNQFFIAPKIGLEFDFLFLGARVNLIDYTNFTDHDLKFTPEAGFTLMGACDLFYGYNYSLTDNKIENIGTNRITFTINFDKVFWGK